MGEQKGEKGREEGREEVNGPIVCEDCGKTMLSASTSLSQGDVFAGKNERLKVYFFQMPLDISIRIFIA